MQRDVISVAFGIRVLYLRRLHRVRLDRFLWMLPVVGGEVKRGWAGEKVLRERRRHW